MDESNNAWDDRDDDDSVGAPAHRRRSARKAADAAAPFPKASLSSFGTKKSQSEVFLQQPARVDGPLGVVVWTWAADQASRLADDTTLVEPRRRGPKQINNLLKGRIAGRENVALQMQPYEIRLDVGPAVAEPYLLV